MNFVSWTFSTIGFSPDYPILLDASNPERSLSLRELRKLVCQLVGGLKHLQIQREDCVLVNCFNDIYYSVFYLGTIGSGAVFTGVNPAYQLHELIHHMRLTKPKLVITEESRLNITLDAAKACGIERSRIFSFSVASAEGSPQVPSWRALLDHGEGKLAAISDPSLCRAVYASTSGTSGLPKMAILSHAYLTSQAKLLCNGYSLPYKVRRLTCLPPFHVFAMPIVPASIKEGSQVYILRRYEMPAFAEHIERYEITETYMAPPVLTDLPKSKACTQESMRSLRQIWVAGARISYSDEAPLYKFLSVNTQINQVWGLTEVGWTTLVPWGKRALDDSVGSPCQHFKIRVIGEDLEEDLEDGQSGEVLIKAPFPMIGYLDDPRATASAFTASGWLRSGDIGYVNNDRLFIIDRKKDLIKVRGWQVSPKEVEDVIRRHEGVSNAAVVGVKYPGDCGEVCKAYVVREPGSTIDEEDVKLFVRGFLASFKVPQEVEFIDAIPTNSTGKILRRELRARNPGHKEQKDNASIEEGSKEGTRKSSTGGLLNPVIRQGTAKFPKEKGNPFKRFLRYCLRKLR